MQAQFHCGATTQCAPLLSAAYRGCSAISTAADVHITAPEHLAGAMDSIETGFD
ncbi:MAG: hypothetical protein AAGK66_09660 [Pseudomonadota bacterium]